MLVFAAPCSRRSRSCPDRTFDAGECATAQLNRAAPANNNYIAYGARDRRSPKNPAGRSYGGHSTDPHMRALQELADKYRPLLVTVRLAFDRPVTNDPREIAFAARRVLGSQPARRLRIRPCSPVWTAGDSPTAAPITAIAAIR